MVKSGGLIFNPLVVFVILLCHCNERVKKNVPVKHFPFFRFNYLQTMAGILAAICDHFANQKFATNFYSTDNDCKATHAINPILATSTSSSTLNVEVCNEEVIPFF
jgi:hypothetical protein